MKQVYLYTEPGVNGLDLRYMSASRQGMMTMLCTQKLKGYSLRLSQEKESQTIPAVWCKHVSANEGSDVRVCSQPQSNTRMSAGWMLEGLVGSQNRERRLTAGAQEQQHPTFPARPVSVSSLMDQAVVKLP